MGVDIVYGGQGPVMIDSEPGGDMYTRTEASVPDEELCMGAMRKIYNELYTDANGYSRLFVGGYTHSSPNVTGCFGLCGA